MGCRRLPPPPVELYQDVSLGIVAAKKQHKIVVLVFGADWDSALSETKRTTLVTHHRFRVNGDPVVIALDLDYSTEIARENRFLDPTAMSAFLRAARKKVRGH